MEEHVNGVPQAESETSKSKTQTGGQASLLKIPGTDKEIDIGTIKPFTIHWSLIILGYLLALLAFTPLVKAAIEAFDNASYMKWVTLGITVIAFILSVFLVYRICFSAESRAYGGQGVPWVGHCSLSCRSHRFYRHVQKSCTQPFLLLLHSRAGPR
ncbi:hypothetical protein [Desulfosarcina variabilis]|uniref:hypothetical protein n=1 Tax=Desulfosarcina variabilis TaxID=2300 RepID=UPI003AFA2073